MACRDFAGLRSARVAERLCSAVPAHRKRPRTGTAQTAPTLV